MAQVTMNQARRDIAINIAVNRPILFVGPVGVGKTTLMRSACLDHAATTGRPFNYIEKRASEMDPTDIGVPMPDPATGRIVTYLPDWLPRVDRDGPEGMLCFDEFTDAQLGVQAVLNQIVLERKHLPLGWRVTATGNRMVDRAAAQKVSRASANRFVIMEATVEFRSTIDWFVANSMAVELIAYLMQCEREGKLEALHRYPDGAGSDAAAFVTPRSLAACSPYFDKALGLSDSELRRQIAHNCGEDTAKGIMAFLASWRLLPDLDALMADPTGATVHREPSTNYALCVGIVARLTMANLPSAVAYVNRLDPLYRATFWSMATARNADFRDTPEHVAHLIAQSKTGI